MDKQALIDALPDINVRRWTPARKAAVVAAIAGNAIAKNDALARYDISANEYDSWVVSINKAGTPGLRVTRLQLYAQI